MRNAETGRVRVVVADDHPSIRENLRYLVNAEDDLEVVGVAQNGTEALRIALDLRPDVLVLDSDMPDGGGLEVLRRLRGERTGTEVVMYTAESDVCEHALRAGARACVTKDEPAPTLLGAIRDAAAQGPRSEARESSAFSPIDIAAGSFAAVEPSDLRDAVQAGDLAVALQPLVELRSRRLSRVEALCRWQHRSRGSIPPEYFIPLAEANGLITPLTLLVLHTAAAQLRDLRHMRSDLGLNLNLSLTTLLDATFHDQLVEALQRASCEPRAVSVEITESMLMREPNAAAEALARLRALGMRVEVDDFGTGYSSLGRLIDLPIDGVKIDRRFVRTMARDHKNEAIVRAIVALAHDLTLEVIAEGVEDRETWDLLGALGCDTVQGYYVGVPMPALTMPTWLASWEAGLGAPPPTSVGAALARRSARGAVLVVDDEPAIVEVIRGVLEHEGFRVVTAANGAEALRELERRLPALVLLDMQMPILDGQAFVRAVRQRKLDVPIVVMTAGSSAARWARELPVEAYLSKPFEIDGLVEVASRYAGRQ